VEDDYGKGPYRRLDTWEGGEEMRAAHAEDPYDHPAGVEDLMPSSPYRDDEDEWWVEWRRTRAWIRDGAKFGFNTLEALEKWFDAYKAKLIRGGYKVAWYQAEEVREGCSKKQLAFKGGRILGRRAW
jgi:hypothetical protein